MSERPGSPARTLSGRLLSPLGIGLVVAVVVALAAGPWPVGVFFDDGLYLVLAKSLATGEGYRYINLPDAPAGVRYPPLYPALLALLWRIGPAFPANVALFKLANACLMGVAAGGIVHLANRRLGLPRGAAALAGLAAALTIPVLATATVLFSEPLFLALLVPTLLVADRAAEEGRMRDAVAAGALCGLLALVRSLGLAALIAAVLVLLVRRRPTRAAALAGVALLLIVPWQLWSAAHAATVPAALQGSYGTYGGFLAPAYRDGGAAFALDVLARNLSELPRIFGALFSPSPSPWLRLPALAACLALLAAGLLRAARRAPAMAAFLVVYLAVVLVWPFAPDRFLWGIWTVVLVTLAAGIATAVAGAATLRERYRRRTLAAWPGIAGRAALAAGALLVCIGFARYEARGLSRRWWESAQRGAAEQAMPLVRWAAQTDTGAVLASDYEPMIYLYAGRRTVPAGSWSATDYLTPMPSSEELAGVTALLDRYHPQFVLATGPGSTAGRSARLLLGDTPAVLVVVQMLPEGGAVFAPTRQ